MVIAVYNCSILVYFEVARWIGAVPLGGGGGVVEFYFWICLCESYRYSVAVHYFWLSTYHLCFVGWCREREREREMESCMFYFLTFDKINKFTWRKIIGGDQGWWWGGAVLDIYVPCTVCHL